MNIARVKDGVVINIEIADETWVAANQGIDGYEFVPYDAASPAAPGYLWDGATFAPPPEPDRTTGSST